MTLAGWDLPKKLGEAFGRFARLDKGFCKGFLFKLWGNWRICICMSCISIFCWKRAYFTKWARHRRVFRSASCGCIYDMHNVWQCIIYNTAAYPNVWCVSICITWIIAANRCVQIAFRSAEAPRAQPFSAEAVLRMAEEGQSQRAGRWLETLLNRGVLDSEPLGWIFGWSGPVEWHWVGWCAFLCFCLGSWKMDGWELSGYEKLHIVKDSKNANVW